MKKRPRKQSSARVSSIAAKVLDRASELGMNGSHVYVHFSGDSGFRAVCTRQELRALAASVLSQDEVKGQGRKRK